MRAARSGGRDAPRFRTRGARPSGEAERAERGRRSRLHLLLASAAAAPAHPLAAFLLAAQIAAYVLGGLALASPAVARWFVARLVGFFLMVNSSVLVAWVYHLSGRRAVTWQPTQR